MRMTSGKTKERDLLRWLEIAAAISSLIGTLGLLVLMAQDARGEGPAGFQPGSRTFNNNPFANSPAAGAGAPGGASAPAPAQGAKNFFDDEDEEEAAPQGGAPGTPGSPGGGFPPGASAVTPGGPGGSPNFASGAGGISMGGTPPSGVISHGNVAAISVNDETGEGSKAIVTDFNFPDADIMDIAKALGKLTGKNFIYDKDAKGRLSIISNAPITVSDAWKAFLTALDMAGFALIPSGKYIRIARQRDARDKQLKTYTGDFSPDTDALITRVIPLKYIQAEDFARAARSFMPANSRIIPYEQTNTIIVTDTGANVAKLAKMLEILDVEGYDAGIEVIPVKYASASDLAKLIDALIPGTQNSTSPGGGAPRFGGGAATSFHSRRTKEGGVINTIIPDERTNTLIVFANTKGADQVRELVAKLDQNKPATGGGKVHVIYLQFADAEAVANTLNNISQASKTGTPSSSSPTGGAGTTGVNPVAASLFEGSIKISPDKSTNALVVTASPTDYETVRRVVLQLDIARDEVYAEVIIMEISTDRKFNFSASIAAPTSGLGSITDSGALTNSVVNPLGLTGGVLGFRSGNSTSITISGQAYQVPNLLGLVNFLQTHVDADILATPQIIALDNTEANFETDENVPYAQSTVSQGVVNNTIAKEQVKLSIKIKPQINKLVNFVKMDVEAQLGSITNAIVPQALQSSAIATTTRLAKTTVMVGDADTVVMGGLTRDNNQETIAKIPLLGDIPVLGWLFKSKNTEVQKLNLLVFITPHIVRQYEKVRAILDQKLKERDDFLETERGGEDAYRYERDRMIRSLPNIQDVTNSKVNNAAVEEDYTGKPAKPLSGAPTTTEPAPNNGQGSTELQAPPAGTPSSENALPAAPPPAGGETPAPPGDGSPANGGGG